MGKLLVHQFVSLDGYAADAGGDFSLFGGGDVSTPEFDLELLVRLQLVDAILLGSTTYRMFADYWPTPASGNQLIAPVINSIEKIVFSHTLDEAPWGEFAPARVESGDAVEVIRTLKGEKFGDLLVWGSLSLTDALFAAGLVDSVRIAVLPVILGSGRSPFPNGFTEREIRLVDSHTFDVGIVASEYAVGHHAPVVTGAIEAPVGAPATRDESSTGEADGAPSAGTAAAGDDMAGSAASGTAVGAYAVGTDGQGSYYEDAAAAATESDDTGSGDTDSDDTGALDDDVVDTDAAPDPAALADAPPAHSEPSPYPESWNVEHTDSFGSDSERPGADLAGADPVDSAHADRADSDRTDQPSTDPPSTDQRSTDHATADQPTANETTDQAPPSHSGPDEFAADSAASLQSADQSTGSVSDPWQPPTAQSPSGTEQTAPGTEQTSGYIHPQGADHPQNDGQPKGAGQPEGESTSDGTGTPENFGTPEAADDAGEDKASATNPAPDPAESEWLLSRRKWE